MGSLLRMGPGYFPTVLGATLAALGLVIVGRSFLMGPEPVPRLALRPLMFVLLSLVLFALLLRRFGLVIATLVMILTCAAGSRQSRLGETLALGVGLTALAVALFYYGLRLPFDIWPQ
jgi:hypothetical protein